MNIMIGLETHVQLNTKSKMFCGCSTAPGEPNTRCCPACLGMPGSKPRLNRKAIDFGISISLALDCRIADSVRFSRKSYFYPDMAKNFQITQYEIPIGSKGKISAAGREIGITRVHLEEDPAKTVHIGGSITKADYVLVDYNRSGMPLAEIVTEPDFKSPKEARLYLQKLSNILEYLGAYSGESESSMRSDANISIDGNERCEIKNIGSFKDVEKALNFEILRQSNILKRGGKLKRETRAWNPASKTTKPLRSKEFEDDYGYITEPDLSGIFLKGADIEKIRKNIPELPEQRVERFVRQYKMSEVTAESLAGDFALSEAFEKISKKVDPKIASSWMAGPLKKTLNYNDTGFKTSGLKDEWIISLLKLFSGGKLTDRNAELALRIMVEKRISPEEAIKKHKISLTGESPDGAIDAVLAKNKKAVEDYLKGEGKSLHFLVGQVMRETKGAIDANLAREIILKKIGKR